MLLKDGQEEAGREGQKVPMAVGLASFQESLGRGVTKCQVPRGSFHVDSFFWRS